MEAELRDALSERERDVALVRTELERVSGENRALKDTARDEAERRRQGQAAMAELTAATEQLRAKCRQLQDRNATLARQVEQVGRQRLHIPAGQVADKKSSCATGRPQHYGNRTRLAVHAGSSGGGGAAA